MQNHYSGFVKDRENIAKVKDGLKTLSTETRKRQFGNSWVQWSDARAFPLPDLPSSSHDLTWPGMPSEERQVKVGHGRRRRVEKHMRMRIHRRRFLCACLEHTHHECPCWGCAAGIAKPSASLDGQLCIEKGIEMERKRTHTNEEWKWILEVLDQDLGVLVRFAVDIRGRLKDFIFQSRVGKSDLFS